MSKPAVLSPAELLVYWQGHRKLTRRVIEAFPEDAFVTHRIGGMRTFSAMVAELTMIGAPMMRELATGEDTDYSPKPAGSRAEMLALWDADTEALNTWFPKVPPEAFGETRTIAGQYTDTVWGLIFYAIDNEVHHRAQGYVYLRSLGIEPPPFWER